MNCMDTCKTIGIKLLTCGICLAQDGDLFKRIQDKSKQKQMFGEDEIMDMFIQVRK